MRKYLIVLGLAFSLMFWSNQTYAQTDPPANHGVTENQSGGGAPVGGGLLILAGLGIAYGGKKMYDRNKSMPEEE